MISAELLAGLLCLWFVWEIPTHPFNLSFYLTGKHRDEIHGGVEMGASADD